MPKKLKSVKKFNFRFSESSDSHKIPIKKSSESSEKLYKITKVPSWSILVKFNSKSQESRKILRICV